MALVAALLALTGAAFAVVSGLAWPGKERLGFPRAVCRVARWEERVWPVAIAIKGFSPAATPARLRAMRGTNLPLSPLPFEHCLGFLEAKGRCM